MNKREFIKLCGQLGIIGSVCPMISSCSEEEVLFYPEYESQFSGKILIVGAGAAGITAGHILNQRGIEFQILEAASNHGGRVKKASDFVDFPIDLGGEWIHTNPSILASLLNDQSSTLGIDLVTFNPGTLSVWKNNNLIRRNIASNFYSEYKFKSTTWFDFFDTFMVPSFRDRILYNSPVSAINYEGDKVFVKTSDDRVYEGDKVLITVPISILQSDFISFVPSLPASKLQAINEEQMPDGLKVFIEFAERFYPDIVMFDNLLEAASSADHTYYNAAFGKESERNVFALFTVGEKATPYTSLGSDEAIFNRVMGELDDMFDGQASQHYINHIVQNWSQTPFIGGSYSQGYASVEHLVEPVSDRLYFAGEAMAPNGNTSTVHGAAESAHEVIRNMLTS